MADPYFDADCLKPAEFIILFVALDWALIAFISCTVPAFIQMELIPCTKISGGAT